MHAWDLGCAWKEKQLNYVCCLLDAADPAVQIVAGLEPEATNVMLQMLAAAAQSGDSNAAVQAVLRRQALETGSGRAQQAGLRPEAAAGAAQCSSDDDEVEAVVFARLDNLLPALSRRMGEAQAALADSGPAVPGSQEALAQCSRVQAVAQVRLCFAQVDWDDGWLSLACQLQQLVT